MALENIVINAIKYAGADKPISIEISVRGDVAVIGVDDAGPGLKPDQYAQVGEAAMLREQDQAQPGFGLGLSLVAHIALAHGGKLTACPGLQGGVHWELRLGSA